ncbi:MAG: holo-ACP synthase [Ignavibacteriaceae bacterium]|nr:holo-ACP synthase [Ignavibacteriaceae bacterium]
MIFGLGIDIIEIERIRQSIEKFGDKFLEKVFTEGEITYCKSKADQYQHFAARFAAKEAVSKSLSDLWKSEYGWKHIEIINNEKGKPEAVLTGALGENAYQNLDIHISISHSHNYACCVAITQMSGGKDDR